MKTFKQFQEQLSSNYTDYKAPPVQAAHARSMGSASRMRQMGMNAVANDPKDDAADNISGTSGVAKPLSGTKIRSGVGKGFKVGDPGIKIEQWYANPTSQTTDSSGETTTTFTAPDGKKQIVKQTKKEKEDSSRINQENKPTNDSLW